MPIKDIRTLGFVLRRTNVGEADRILNLITPQGKLSVIAKGARREKSKLAGGIEVFTLSDFNIHFGKSEIGTLTGAKMVKHYSNLMREFDKMELAGSFLKRINLLAEQSDSEEFFEILKQSLEGLNDGMEASLVEAWFLLNTVRASGEEINFHRDKGGEKLRAGVNYAWDVYESAFFETSKGEFGTDEIKVLRLMITSKLGIIGRVKMDNVKYGEILRLAKIISKL